MEIGPLNADDLSNQQKFMQKIVMHQNSGSLFDLKKGDSVLVGGHEEMQKMHWVSEDYNGGAGMQYSKTFNPEQLVLSGGLQGATDGVSTLTSSIAYHCQENNAATNKPYCNDLVLSGVGAHNVCSAYSDGSGNVCASDGNDATAAVVANSLYKVNNGNGYKPIIVTESLTGATYQYVSSCSNRGICDDTFGVCDCFAGYTSWNCDTQNARSI